MNETAAKVPLWWFIHPTSWNRNSANFALTQFSEFQLPLSGFRKFAKNDALKGTKIHREFIAES